MPPNVPPVQRVWSVIDDGNNDQQCDEEHAEQPRIGSSACTRRATHVSVSETWGVGHGCFRVPWCAANGEIVPPIEYAAHSVEWLADNVSQEGDKGIDDWRRVSVYATLAGAVATVSIGRSGTTRSDIGSWMLRAGLLGGLDAAGQHILWHRDRSEAAIDWERSAAVG